jgi:hypothetical protein
VKWGNRLADSGAIDPAHSLLDLQHRVLELEAELDAQSALVLAQEMALRSYAHDHVVGGSHLGQGSDLDLATRVLDLQTELADIRRTITWRIHGILSRAPVIRRLARMARRLAEAFGHLGGRV